MNDFQYFVYCPICSAKVNLYNNYCSNCGYCLTGINNPYAAGIEEETNDTLGDNFPTTDNDCQLCKYCGSGYYEKNNDSEPICPNCYVYYYGTIKELPNNSTPTNAELRDKLNKIIRRLK